MTLIGADAPAVLRRLCPVGGRSACAAVLIGLLAWCCDAALSRAQGFSDVPLTNLTPVPQPSVAPPPSGFHSPLYDPYSSTPGAGAYAPAVPGMAPVTPTVQYPGWLPGGTSPQGQGTFGGLFSGSPVNAAPPPTFGMGNPGFTTQPAGPGGLGQTSWGAQPYGTPVMPPTAFPPEAYPSGAPNTLFPSGIYGGSGLFGGGPLGGWNNYRVYQGPRLQHGWIRGGDSPRSLQMNETDASLVFAFQNFFYSGQPVYVIPSFSLTLLEGPNSSTGADLPGQVYGAYIDSGWQSDPNQMLSVDLGLRTGVFSDFDAQNSDSFRLLGRGVGHFRLSPFSTLKAGAYYLDRNRVTWLPAIGMLYQPNPLTRYDIFFPEPKLSRYFTTLGTQDVWSYAAGQYGGDSWTVRREDGRSDRVDINDLRLLLGLEWGRNDLLRQGRRTGFFEVGYVFNRELVYRRNPQDNIDLNDSILLRLGLGY